MEKKPNTAKATVKPDSKADELVQACLTNDELAVSTSLELGISPNSKSSLGLTPLIVAAENGYIGLVQLLLEKGADPNLVSNSNYPLRAAILSGDGEVIQELIKCKADVNLETPRGTPLIVASAEGDCESIGVLLDSGADVNYETKDGLTALIAAVRDDRREAVKLLLKRGANPNRQSKDSDLSAIDIAQEKVGYRNSLPTCQ